MARQTPKELQMFAGAVELEDEVLIMSKCINTGGPPVTRTPPEPRKKRAPRVGFRFSEKLFATLSSAASVFRGSLFC